MQWNVILYMSQAPPTPQPFGPCTPNRRCTRRTKQFLQSVAVVVVVRLFDGPGIQHLQARARSSRASATRANAEKQRRAKAELPRRSGAQHNGSAAESCFPDGLDRAMLLDAISPFVIREVAHLASEDIQSVAYAPETDETRCLNAALFELLPHPTETKSKKKQRKDDLDEEILRMFRQRRNDETPSASPQHQQGPQRRVTSIAL